MRLTRWLAIMLTICVLCIGISATTAEEMPLEIEGSDSFEGEPDGLVGEVGESGEFPEMNLPDTGVPVEEDVIEAAPTEAGSDGATESLSYARVRKSAAPLYDDYAAYQCLTKLSKGDVVLVLGEEAGLKAVAVNASGAVVEGFMKPSHLTGLSAKAEKSYRKKAARGEVALYRENMDWPLAPVSASVSDALASNNANYDDLSNDTTFKMNGKKIKASDVESQGLHNCWKWANKIYKMAWGTSFDSSFTGSSGKDLNLLRNLTDDERKLTPENLKYFVRNSVPGATLRVTNCVSTCSGFKTDSCGRHAYLHSLIIAEIRSDGLVTMDDQNKVHTRFYTWEGFCRAWAKWDHIKYIKWPNAPALPSASNVDGYSVTGCSVTYRPRATLTEGVGVWSKPSGGTVLTTLTYPETFKARKMALKVIDGYNWVYGKTSTGMTGWLPLMDGIVDIRDTIKVTGVALNKTQLLLLKGGNATLKATIAPVDATDRTVSWTSSDTQIATVQDGVVTGVNGGTVTITATSVDGSKKATCTVWVAGADTYKTLAKTGSNGSVKLRVGQELQLIPKFATKKHWKVKGVSSSNRSCASVSSSGVVTARKAGSATITVKTRNGKKATLKVYVYDPNEVTGVELNLSGTVKLKRGATGRLYARVTPANASTTLTWKSSDPRIACVDSMGNVTGLRAGVCKIGVKTENGKYDTVTVWVV